jgi:anti-sigma regulatory factor (Ser/Thr protein kinase)
MSTPAPRVIDRFRHEAMLYAGWADFIAGTVPFIRGGVEAGEPVLVVESAEKIEMLRVALDRDADLVHFADMSEVGANPARIIPAWQEFVTKHGSSGRRLRGIGEPIWKGRTPDELVECQRHESLLNVAFGGGRPWWLLCPYDKEKLDPSIISEARRSHEFVVDGTKEQNNPSFRGPGESGAPFDAPLPEPSVGVRELDFEQDGLVAIRGLVARYADGAGLDPSRSAELVTAVNEVATNSIHHGGGRGMFRIWQDTTRLTCEVRDAGRFDRPLVDRVRPETVVSAPRGLWLANQLCDLVQIRTFANGTVVRLHVLRPTKRPVHRATGPTTRGPMEIN